MQRLSRLVLALLILSVPDFAGSSAAAAPPAKNPSPVGRAQSPIWRNECIDCPKQYHVLGDHSLALDTRSHPHIAYASDLLYYARYTGSVWEIEELGLAPGSEELYESIPALALDQADTVHLAYPNSANTALLHAQRTTSGWQVQMIDGGPGKNFAYDVSLALDSGGDPHVAYSTNGRLTYAFRKAAGWNTQTVDQRGWLGWHISLALDSQDHAHISYYDDFRGELRYAHWTGLAWQVETVDNSAWLGEFNSIAVDSDDQAHISYLDYTRGQLKYARRTPAGWHIQVVDALQWFGGFTSLVLDSADHPHISYAGPPPAYAIPVGSVMPGKSSPLTPTAGSLLSPLTLRAMRMLSTTTGTSAAWRS